MKRSVADADVAGKRALVRVDFNVPMHGGEIGDDTRIRAALPTIRLLRDRGAAVILMSHLGRPKGRPNPDLSLAPVSRRLGTLLERDVTLVPLPNHAPAEQPASRVTPGEVVLLENLRFDPGEEANTPAFARSLAALGDIYVDDAFGAAHRSHASIVGIAEHLPAYAGLLLLAETETLEDLLRDPARPFIAILGGAKVSDKFGVIDHLLDVVDRMLIGGGMANTFLLAQGREIGASLAERDRLEDARFVLQRAQDRGVDLLLPVDVRTAPSIDAETATIVAADAVPADDAIFDIGPQTEDLFAASIATAGTIFWNGPMGVFERPPFAAGTLAVAHAVAAAPAFTVVGGGDSVAAVEAAQVADAIDHISTGGGASLELLEGKMLPGLAVIPEG